MRRRFQFKIGYIIGIEAYSGGGRWSANHSTENLVCILYIKTLCYWLPTAAAQVVTAWIYVAWLNYYVDINTNVCYDVEGITYCST
jgi:hypothetical protein